jgi:hypothetical protein
MTDLWHEPDSAESIQAGNVWEEAIEAAVCSSAWAAGIFAVWCMFRFRGGA